MSAILIRIHHLRLDGLTRTHCPLNLAARWVPCRFSKNICEAYRNGFGSHCQQSDLTMRYSVDSVHQATIRFQMSGHLPQLCLTLISTPKVNLASFWRHSRECPSDRYCWRSPPIYGLAPMTQRTLSTCNMHTLSSTPKLTAEYTYL